MNNTELLLENILKIQKRPEMYFGRNPSIDNIFSFLMGWDYASDSKWTRALMYKISQRLGLAAVYPEDISFNESIEILIELIHEKQEDTRKKE